MTNTSTDTFRELCAKLADAYEHELDKRGLDCDLLCRARAALAQPEPEGPTDDELLNLGNDVMGDCLPCDPDLLIAFARAALARFGRPAIKPVPVSERLPGPEDCDEEGRCWWEYPESKRIVYDMNPIDKEEITTPPAYYLQKKHPLCSPNQRWLPHHALPVPTTRSDEFIPYEARKIAAALRAAASIPSASAPVPFKYKLLAIATELEGKSNENPN